MASISFLLLLFISKLVNLNALFKTYKNRTEWQNDVEDWAKVVESWSLTGDKIESAIKLPSGSSLSLKTGASTCIGQSTNSYMNLNLMYGLVNKPIIYCEPSPIEFTFIASKPIFSFGLEMEPVQFGNYRMSIILNDDTTLTQLVASSEDLASPTFFGFIASDKSNFISSMQLVSTDTSAFMFCNMVEGKYTPPTADIIPPTSAPAIVTSNQSSSSSSNTLPWWPFVIAGFILLFIIIPFIFYFCCYEYMYSLCGGSKSQQQQSNQYQRNSSSNTSSTNQYREFDENGRRDTGNFQGSPRGVSEYDHHDSGENGLSYKNPGMEEGRGGWGRFSSSKYLLSYVSSRRLSTSTEEVFISPRTPPLSPIPPGQASSTSSTLSTGGAERSRDSKY